jgi:hypothetical protein
MSEMEESVLRRIQCFPVTLSSAFESDCGLNVFWRLLEKPEKPEEAEGTLIWCGGVLLWHTLNVSMIHSFLGCNLGSFIWNFDWNENCLSLGAFPSLSISNVVSLSLVCRNSLLLDCHLLCTAIKTRSDFPSHYKKIHSSNAFNQQTSPLNGKPANWS